jgi:hypothetical protein
MWTPDDGRASRLHAADNRRTKALEEVLTVYPRCDRHICLTDELYRLAYSEIFAMAQNALLGTPNVLLFCRCWIVLHVGLPRSKRTGHRCYAVDDAPPGPGCNLSPPVMARSRRLPLLYLSHSLGYLLTL